MENISLGHGSGGSLTSKLIADLFFTHFDNPILKARTDAAILNPIEGKIAFTTDSYVVTPIEFPGANIGKLAICGTVNDLSVAGAIPQYISVGFIIEEGLAFTELERIVVSMAEEAKKAGVLIVTGDTKVVEKGKCDKLFINTSGIGLVTEDRSQIALAKQLKADDVILINGTLGDHAIAILSARKSLSFETPVLSDCASLNGLIQTLYEGNVKINFMRDATRGGLATVLCELADEHNASIQINEASLPINEAVSGACEIFGFEPIYMANEGKLLMIMDKNDADKALEILKKHPLGKDAAIIGKIIDMKAGKVVLKTEIGGSRLLQMMAGEQLPRIC